MAVGSHDTASAVVGVPADLDRFAYISCGTWSLVGVELEEAGAERGEPDGGLHQRARRRRHRPLPAQRHGPVAAPGVAPHLGRRRAARRPDGPAGRRGPRARLHRPGRPRRRPLPAPGGHAGPDRRGLRQTGQTPPQSQAETVRCILDSLALAHRRTVREASELSGREVEVVHLVGGGARNALLCQLTADACGVPVIAGPVEAAALGNALVQARAGGVLAGGLPELRALLRATSEMRTYLPTPGAEEARGRRPPSASPRVATSSRSSGIRRRVRLGTRRRGNTPHARDHHPLRSAPEASRATRDRTRSPSRRVTRGSASTLATSPGAGPIPPWRRPPRRPRRARPA